MKFLLLYIVLPLSMIFNLDRSNDKSLTLMLFLSHDCVICQSYSPLYQQLKAYEGEIDIIGIFPNFSSKRENIDSFVRKFKFPFPTKTDYSKKWVDRFEIEIVPTVVLYNESDRSVVYKGKIDNAFVSLGRRRKVVTEHNLLEVLEAIRLGNMGPFESTDPIGCFIEKFNPFKE